MATDLESFINQSEPSAGTSAPDKTGNVAVDGSLNQGIVDLYNDQPDPNKLGYAMSKAKGVPPETAAQVLSLQDKTGVPADVVQRNLPQVQEDAAKKDTDWAQYHKDHPNVSAWLMENPNHAALAQNDTENLGYIERLWGSIKNAYRQTKISDELSKIGTSAILGTRTQEDRDRQADLENELSQMPNYGLTGASKIPGLMVNFATSKASVRGLEGAVAGLPFGASGLGMTAGFAGQGAKDAAAHMYLNLEKRGIDRKTALGLSLMAGELNGAMMLAPVAKLTGIAPGLSWLSNLGVDKVLASPTVMRAVARYGTNIIENYGVMRAMGGAQSMVNSISEDIAELHKSGHLEKMTPGALLSTFFRDENIQKANEASKESGLTGIGIGTVTGAFGLPGDIRATQRAEMRSQVFSEIGKTVHDSETFKNLPSKMQQLISRMTKDGGFDTGYIPIENFNTYWQGKNIDPRDAYESITGDAKPYDDAFRASTDLPIKMDKYAVTIAPTEHNTFFQDELRLNPNEMNARESRAYLKARMSEMADQTKSEGQTPTEDSAERVRQNVEKQLIEQGYSNDAAAFHAQLYKSAFSAMGQRSGLDPEQLYNRYGLNIQRLNAELPTDEEAIKGRAESMAAKDTTRFESERAQFDQWREILKSGIKKPKGLEDEYRQIPSWMKKMVGGRGYDEVSQEAIERGLMEPGEDLWVKLRSIESPKEARSEQSFHEEARRQMLEENAVNPNVQLEQSGTHPAFYSAVEQAIDAKMPAKAPGSDILGMLRNTPGVKQDELDWIGLPEFLEGKKSVTKQEVSDFIRANNVQVKETTLGADDKRIANEVMPKLRKLGYRVEMAPGDATDEYQLDYVAGPDGMTYTPDTFDSIPNEEAKSLIRQVEAADTKWPKFAAYQLPGGENYRELLLTLPGKTMPEGYKVEERPDGLFHVIGEYGGDLGGWKTREDAEKSQSRHTDSPAFKSSHFDEPNILAHVRFNDRIDADGNKVLFLEEIQSDWHQKGRTEGYRNDPEAAKKFFGIKDDDWEKMSQEEKASYVDEMGSKGGVPDAPFKKTWHELALKRMLRYAAENGYDKIAWTTGDQQAERYDLSKQIDSLKVLEGNYSEVNGTSGYEVTAMKNGREVINKRVSAEDLPGLIGKDMAQKAIDQIAENKKKPVPQYAARFAGLDLKVGGEGMKGFYDQMLPSFLNKYAKKWGGRVGETELKTIEPFTKNGIRITDPTLDETGREPVGPDYYKNFATEKSVNVHSLEITPSMRESVMGGQALFQGERGFLRFGPDRQMNIGLLKKADLSTFLHETGHLYVEVMRDLSKSDTASDQIKSDWGKLREFAGAKEGEELSKEHHETLAKAFEAYLMEGKAPSEALRTPFMRFRAWLLSVYRKMSGLGVELTPEVRGVFDRMLASDDEINSAQAQQDMAPMFPDPKAMGMTDTKAKQYEKAITAARESAETRLFNQQMDEIKSQTRKDWKRERAEVRQSIANEIDSNPEQLARAFLKDGTFPDGSALPGNTPTFKLSKQAILEDFPNARLSDLRGMYVPEGGVHPDQAAAQFGFKSGAELLTALRASEDRNTLLDRMADEQMKQAHGDLMNRPELAEAAMKAVHNEDRARVLQLELQHLASEELPALKGMIRQMTRRIPRLDEITAQAHDTVMDQSNRDIKPSLYQRAEARSSREAGEALARGDVHGAFEAKQRELLNHELYQAAADWKDRQEKILDYLGKFDKESVRDRIAQGGRAGGDYLEQIDALLDRYDIRKSVTLKELAQRKDLAEWLKEQRMEKGYDVDIPEKFLQDADRIHWKDMKAQDFDDLYSTIKNIEHLAKDQAQILRDGMMHDYALVLNDLRSSIRSYYDISDTKEPPVLTKNRRERMVTGTKQTATEHFRPEFRFKELDGWKDNGPYWRTFFKPTADAENNELVWRRQSIDAISKIMDGAYSHSEQRALWSRIDTPEIGGERTLNKMNLLMMAANHGNHYNLEGMLKGTSDWLSEDQLQNMMEHHLTLKDWQVVEAMAEHVGSWWPKIAEMEKRLNGITPERVEGDPISVKTSDGQVFKSDGWYWPIKFDPEQDIAAKKAEAKENVQDLFGGSYARAQTKQGHLQARTNTAGRPFQLDFATLSDHLSNVIHDLATREVVININKLLSDPDIRHDISSVQGKEGYAELMPWLRRVAGEKMGNPISKTEGLIGPIRANMATAELGLRLPVALKHLLSYGAGMRELGPKYTALGLRDVWAKPWQIKDVFDFIAERDPMMANRQMFLDRDLREYWKGFEGLTRHDANIQRSFTMFLNAFDLATSMPTWMGAYRKAMEGQVDDIKPDNEPDAIAYAQSMVRMTKGSSSPKDLPSVMVGSPAYKLWTMFYGPMNLAINNMNRTRGEFVQDRNIPKVIAGAALTWFVPALLHDRISRGVSQDDKEHPIRNSLIDVAGFPMEGTVFGRNIIQAAKAARGASDEPFSAFLHASGKTIQAASERTFGSKDELSRADINAMIETMGSLTGIPTRQIWGSTESLYDWMVGNDSPDSTLGGLWNVAKGKKVSS